MASAHDGAVRGMAGIASIYSARRKTMLSSNPATSDTSSPDMPKSCRWRASAGETLVQLPTCARRSRGWAAIIPVVKHRTTSA